MQINRKNILCKITLQHLNIDDILIVFSFNERILEFYERILGFNERIMSFYERISCFMREFKKQHSFRKERIF